MVTAGAQETEAGLQVHSILGAWGGGAAGSWGAFYDHGSCGGSLVYDHQSLGTPRDDTRYSPLCHGVYSFCGDGEFFYFT